MESLDVRPYQLMCLVCALGGDDEPANPLLQAIREQPDRPMMLRCNVTSSFRYQNPGMADDTPEGALFNVRRDLAILQRLGLAPGATRPARQLLRRLLESVEDAVEVCGGPATSATWRGCALAASSRFARGRARGLEALIPPRDAAEMARVKAESAAATETAAMLYLRPHHLLCMACFHGGQAELAPIAADNLYEAIVAIQRNPEIPVTLIAGCCMICPPCALYDPASGLCIGENGMGLRDEKKDLDVLRRLDLTYGDVLPARELYARLFQAIRSTTEICGHGDGVVRGWEWSICGGPGGNDAYRVARRSNMGIAPESE